MDPNKANILNYYSPENVARMNDEDLNAACQTHGLTLEDFLKARKLDEERYRRMSFITPDKHYYNIIHRFGDATLSAKYSSEYIRQLIKDNSITELELKSRGIFNQEELDVIMGRPLKAVDPKDFKPKDEIFKALPHLADNRVDLFILGVSGSGKSSFLSGILKGAKDTGNLDLPMMLDENGKASNKYGMLYANHLIDSLEQHLPASRTEYEFFTYVAVNFRDSEEQIHPLSFMEMSGELFQECYGKDKAELPDKLQQYLFHDNLKMLFCVIDYHVHSEHKILDVQQWAHFQWFLQLLDVNGTMQRCQVISILITKWDLAQDGTPEGARKFLEEEYLNLYKSCQRYAEKYHLKFQIITFSLGKFDARNRVSYNPSDSEKVINWLCKNTPVQSAKSRKKSWFNL